MEDVGLMVDVAVWEIGIERQSAYKTAGVRNSGLGTGTSAMVQLASRGGRWVNRRGLSTRSMRLVVEDEVVKRTMAVKPFLTKLKKLRSRDNPQRNPRRSEVPDPERVAKT